MKCTLVRILRMRMLGHIFPQLLNVLIIIIYDDLLRKVIANINLLHDQFRFEMS